MRQIVWHGKIEYIVCEHAFAYSGRMPCTGPIRCIHCGATPESARAQRLAIEAEMTFRRLCEAEYRYQQRRRQYVRCYYAAIRRRDRRAASLLHIQQST